MKVGCAKPKRSHWPHPSHIIAGLFALAAAIPTLAQPKPPEQDRNQAGAFLESNINRPLRYHPIAREFVITNGTEYFNRPLYGANIPFRVDGGDRPEFSFYLPGRGGNLRFGFRSTTETGWLDRRQEVIARYRPGGMSYDISGAAPNDGHVRLDVLPLRHARGLVGRVELGDYSLGSAEFILAFGGVNGMRGQRGGDIGCEREPVSQFFRLRPQQCASNSISTTGSVFIVRGPTATMAGLMSPAFCNVADGHHWNELFRLIPPQTSPPGPPVPTDAPVALMRRPMIPHQPIYFIVIQADSDVSFADLGRDYGSDQLPSLFEKAESDRRAIGERVLVETPDRYINAAAAALNVAADAVWDARQTSFMHGAVAWRNRLLGWRGQYAGDALGWHERTRQHLEGFAKQQNITLIPEAIPTADEDTNLARSEKALHSNGNLTRNHYDMNLVAVDAFFRHLLWTGDLDFARKLWPMLERHFDWERRLFRREFGPDKLPLYEGYAAIWASDDLTYNGGGTAHTSAYNFYHNKMAARIAKLIGKDPMPYEKEADLIAKAMRRELWLSKEGWFAEYKDCVGLKLVHPSAALWTYYHTIDSEVPTPEETWRMTGGLDTQFARIPLRGPDVPPGNFTLPTSSWMPYSWSINNVVMAEVMHTALAYWQANRPAAAFPLFKGAALDSMFLGLCPGNVGLCTWFDTYRRESQRDFADGVGATSRALIEGLFGIKPDALAGELTIRPGFPDEWSHARLRHPDLSFSYRRDGPKEILIVEQRFAKPMALRLFIPQRLDTVASVTVNGQPARSAEANLPGEPRLEIGGSAVARHEVVVEWRGAATSSSPQPDVSSRRKEAHPNPSRESQSLLTSAAAEFGAATFDWRKRLPASARLDAIDLSSHFNDRVSQIFSNDYRAPRSPFASLATPKQGIGSWCHPFDHFNVDDSGLRAVARTNHGRFMLPNGVVFATPPEPGTPNIIFTSQWTNYPAEATVPLTGNAKHAYFLMAGSTSHMQSRLDNGEITITYTDGSTDRLALYNPTTWWPIDQDYFIDDFAFRRPEAIPPRVDLKTGRVRVLEVQSFKGRGREIPGGAATVLELPLNPTKELQSLTLQALANEVVIGLMSVTLERD
jgi:hypothetical protein